MLSARIHQDLSANWLVNKRSDPASPETIAPLRCAEVQRVVISATVVLPPKAQHRRKLNLTSTAINLEAVCRFAELTMKVSLPAPPAVVESVAPERERATRETVIDGIKISTP